jgi:hypothetical protein
MLIIKHRVNTVEELIQTQQNFGVEIDVRTSGSDLIIQHDPFESGEKLSEWLKYFQHKFLIVNVKEDGLEHFVYSLIQSLNIGNFFFIDQAFPSLYKFSKMFPEYCALRVSDIEAIETALNLRVGWIWLDSHSGNWDYLSKISDRCLDIPAKKCLVSPELQRSDFESELYDLKDGLNTLTFKIDAVCTKLPNKWI